MDAQNDVLQLTGMVDHIVFCNDDNGWTVLELDTGDAVVTVVGTFPRVQVGETLRVQGNWTNHPSFGTQFKATACESTLPTDATAILRYLASGAVKGIGPATAARIVDRFGANTLRILEEKPFRLAEIKGISLSKAREMGASFAAQFGLREVVMTFGSYGLSPNEALRCFKKFGPSTLTKIKENPYLLCTSGLRIGFERADQICLSQGGDTLDAHRLEAGVQYVLRHNLGNGHTCLPRDKVIPTAMKLLEVPEASVDAAVNRMIESFQLREVEMEGRPYLFLPRYYDAEVFIANRMRLMSGMGNAVIAEDVQLRIDAMERNFHITYEEQQRKAMVEAVATGALILTGGPSTGKTTTLRGVITLLESMGETVAIAAPTGRAAKRISQLTGREAKTIHRLLEVRWGADSEEDGPTFDRNERNPLDADAVVVDEMSMVDVVLFEHLLRATKTGCRLILVGDTDQLPAVGAGCVLQDLMDSGVVPVVQLTQVFRQALESRIVYNAHRIVKGESMEWDTKSDCFYMPRPSAAAVTDTVLELCHHRLPDAYGYTHLDSIQVLCPGRKGEVGTVEMNRRLQDLLNPPDKKKAEIAVEGVTLRVGDKVMHNRNNYDIPWTKDDGDCGSGIFNGDIGVLEEIRLREGMLSVRFEDRVATYTKDDAQDLELAYAITVHKSQGSEFEAVILPLFRNTPHLCYRNLLYTAVTRAKSLLIIVGSRETLDNMIENDRKTLRYTGLRKFLMMEEGFLL